MYFGTIAHLRVKPDRIEDFVAYGEQRQQEGPEDSVATIVFQSSDDPTVFYLVAIAESEEEYRAVAADPDTHQQYLQMMEFLQAEPEWHDGYVLFSQFPQVNRR